MRVLRLCFEAATQNEHYGLFFQTGAIDQGAAAEGISPADLQAALELLVQQGLIKAQLETRHPFHAMLTPLGFRTYVGQYIPDIGDLKRAVAAQILAGVRDGVAVAEATQRPGWLINWMFSQLEYEGLVRAFPTAGSMRIIEVKALLRKVYGPIKN
jgi:hypothetical protein